MRPNQSLQGLAAPDYLRLDRAVGRGAVVNGMRLSLSRTLAVPTSDLTAQTTLYWVPTGTGGDVCDAWNGRDWVPQRVPYSPDAANQRDIVSMPLTGIVAASVYDIFAYWKNGRWALRKIAWQQATQRWGVLPAMPWMRPDGLAVHRGRLIAGCRGFDMSNPSDGPWPEMLYLGTICASANDQCEDSKLIRYCVNAYNRVQRILRVVETTSSWTVSSAAFQSWNQSDGNRVKFVSLGDAPTFLLFQGLANNSVSAYSTLGIGLDTTTTNDADLYDTTGVVGQVSGGLQATYATIISAGSHFLQLLQATDGAASTFYGFASGIRQSGAIGYIWG